MHRHVSTPLAANSWVCRPRSEPSRRQVAMASKRRSRGPQGDRMTFRLGEAEFTVPKQSFWQLAAPAAVLLGFASLIGPLVIGAAFAAMAVGIAISAGALTAALILPGIIMLSLGMFLFAGPFGLFAALSVGVINFALKSLFIVAAGLGLGWAAVQMALPGRTTSAGREPPIGDSRDSWQAKGEQSTVTEEDEEAARRARELRDFDEILARRQQDKNYRRW